MSKIKKALLKAKETRETNAGEFFAENYPTTEPAADQLTSDGRRIRKDLEVVYQQTKVYNLDPNVLRRNKLFSLFKNNKMTDHFDIAKGQLLKKLDKLKGNCVMVTRQ